MGGIRGCWESVRPEFLRVVTATAKKQRNNGTHTKAVLKRYETVQNKSDPIIAVASRTATTLWGVARTVTRLQITLPTVTTLHVTVRSECYSYGRE